MSLTSVLSFGALPFSSSDYVEVYGAVHWQRDQVQVRTYV